MTGNPVTDTWIYATANFIVECVEHEVGFIDPMVHAPAVVEAIADSRAIVTRATARVLWRSVEVGSASLADCIYPFCETKIDPSTGSTDDDNPNDYGRNIQTDHSYRHKVVRWAIADARTNLADLGVFE